MLKNLLLLFIINSIIFITAFSSKAQKRTCGSMEVLENKMKENPNLSKKMEDIEQFTKRCIQRSRKTGERIAEIITIPVVVHVIYQTDVQNISDAQILSQMEVLNNDFRRTNTDADNTWAQAADTQIEFCMANTDPDGNASNGITRKFVDRSTWGANDAMKRISQGGVNPWPTSSYLNMWVCNIGGGILGYAQFPGGDTSTDGVVISPQYFGTIGSVQVPFNGGRTTTHEVGHWLNLRHIWGDGGCGVDDFISDTPTSDGPNYDCATEHLSCETTDMVQNYMDYSDDACMNLYTLGQKERMRALFDLDGNRTSLLNSSGCSGNNETTGTCSDGIQNQGETAVDCGGPCSACPNACQATEVKLTIKFDNFPEETSWEITNAAGNIVASGGPYTNQEDRSSITLVECLNDACYDFSIKDIYADGMCCSYGSGSYSLTANGNTLASGGSFTAIESTNFCIGEPAPAPTCEDGIQNQGETAIDCGGPCAACPSCDDGLQNQDETGVDCGGSCTPCSTICQSNEVDISLNFDNYPEETSWEIINASGETILSGGPYNNQADGSTLSITECLSDGCYSFTISDVYSDGICCSYGNGSYTLIANGITLASGGSFTTPEISNFCFETDNTGQCTYENINNEDFESSWGIWNDGGFDSYRNNYAPYASSGSYTIRVRDNSSSSIMTSDNINASSYQELTVEFSYYPIELENSEDFWLQISTDGGATFTTIKTWAKGVEFENNTAYRELVTISQAFSANTKIRFRVDASVNNDRIYFDDIEIKGCKLNN